MAQDAIALLEADHQRVETLFRDFQASSADQATKLDLAQIICMELTMHATLEEELFYPALAQASGDRQLVQHALDEHQQVKELIAQVPQAQDVDGIIAEIAKNMLQHIEEERRDIFPKAKSSGMDLAALGQKVESRRSELAAVHQEA
ncbi:MAG: hemerythrin domain-containing protein [Ramlibacter sp.]